ncbi:hypothetical protein BGY98DRAFT_943194 [Russula aff. rugulosa BPL654]|nr:hypothetical protein BGY98DRAFT_943194 [Russula aff. rugulosa BPL654]
MGCEACIKAHARSVCDPHEATCPTCRVARPPISIGIFFLGPSSKFRHVLRVPDNDIPTTRPQLILT